MEKPTCLLRKEFMDNIVKMVNDSKLPFFVIEPILKDLYITVKEEAERVYRLEKEAYEKALKEENEVD